MCEFWLLADCQCKVYNKLFFFLLNPEKLRKAVFNVNFIFMIVTGLFPMSTTLSIKLC